jgi:5-methylcytosine-specific restriction protein B
MLRERHNVLITGAPGTGKTRLTNQVREAFQMTPPLPYDKNGPIPFPKDPSGGSDDIAEWLPSPDRRDRRVFSTVFHQGTKHRDFVCGLAPVPGGKSLTFKVQRGTLLEAAKHAQTPDGASLLVVEEVNRGPAVAAFGGSIVAFEGDKRLSPNNEILPTTTFFEVLDDHGNPISYALPHPLYLIATMNQADTSVESLDVAFLRRWARYRLTPSSSVLLNFFGLDGTETQPEVATEGKQVYAAAVAAWQAVNDRISIGRDPEFQIGHGVLMTTPAPPSDPIAAAACILQGWESLRSHIEEVFFGDVLAIAEVLNIGPHNPSHAARLVDHEFAGGVKSELVVPPITIHNLYALLKAIAGPVRP